MLAHIKTSLTLAITVAVLFATSFASGQQPQLPSQRYQPVPPSVHVPPKNSERIQLDQARRMIKEGALGMQNSRRPSSQYRFAAPNAPVPTYESGTVQQTSYTAKAPVEVPNILTGQAQQALPPATSSNAPANPANAPASPTMAQSEPELPRARDIFSTQTYTPANVASEPITSLNQQMVEQIQRSNPVVDPQDLANEQANVNQAKQQLMQVRERASQAANEMQQVANDFAPAKQTNQTTMSEDEFVDRLMAAAQAQPVSTQAPVSQTVQQPATPEMPVNQMPVNELQTPQSSMTAPTLTAKPIQSSETNAEAGEPVNQIRQVSIETSAEPMEPVAPVAKPTTNRTTPEISLAAPGIEVQTFGPRTIGINKTSTYKIIVSNIGRTDANRVLIGINMPQWVDIANTNMSNGQKEITDGVNQARLVWTVENVPANSTQTITIDTVPRKAEMFDLGVEWTFAPRVGTTTVEVTEPRLEMKIAGPRDVLYGEKAIYHVTVRNPGTGAAENVTVMLPEALGGERATLGEIPAGREKNFQVELLARTAGQLDLAATAKAEGNLNTQAVRQITVRRANLGVIIDGPPMKYAGGVGQYSISINNTGDATAQDVIAAIALPAGVKYLGGVDNAKEIEGGLKWQVGSIEPGDQRSFKINCELNAAGELQVEAGARGNGDLAASSACVTSVETVADLVLIVADPKGPLPTGEDVLYEIKVRNRGTKAARDVQLVMQFSEGIEPNDAKGLKHRVVPGQVLFSPIAQVDPNEEMTFSVTAKAFQPGTHIFRAQLTCADSDAREIAEGTTRFFGDAYESTAEKNASETENNEFQR